MFGIGSQQQQNEQPIRLYVLLLVHKSNGQTQLFQYIGVARTDQDAAIKAMEKMKEVVPELWQKGIENGGFQVKLQNIFDKEGIIRIFDSEEKPKITEIIEVPDPVTEKSLLIKSVIDRNDIGYLEQKRFEFTEYEYQYIKEKIYDSQHQDTNS